MSVLNRNLVHTLAGVLALSAVLAIGDATVSGATGTTPTITKVSPDAGPATGGTAITITGTGFANPASVVIGQGNGTNGAIAATDVDVVSSTEITATTGGGAVAGTFNVYVTTSAGTSAANTGSEFTYSRVGRPPRSPTSIRTAARRPGAPPSPSPAPDSRAPPPLGLARAKAPSGPSPPPT